LEINSLGQADERAQHRAALITYFEQHANALDADSQRRLKTNPLRILDSKNPDMQALIEGAPRCWIFWDPNRWRILKQCKHCSKPITYRAKLIHAWCGVWIITT
jgi:histidyl-tRNA synthetase